MKKTIFTFAIMLVAMGCFALGNDDSEGTITLELLSNSNSETLEVYKQIASEFTKEYPHIIVNASTQGRDYEALMKSNMAANSLPDLFMTHGWSVARYSEYLRPLNDQPWIDKIVSSMVPILSNEDDEIFVLPIDIEQAGIVVNHTVLNEAGIDPYSLHTWEDFLNACEAIKNNGKTPIGMWGKDARTFSQYLDVMANPYYVSSPSNNYTSELQGGTFDWSNWDLISQSLVDLHDNGYLNVDVLTADADTIYQEVAKNNIAFMVTPNQAVSSILEYNPNAEVGFIPYPAIYSDDTRQLVGGEREAVGVWKDGEHVEEALLFLEFLSRPENIKLVCEFRGNAPAISDIEVDLGYLTSDYQRYQEEGVAIYPYFDRVMLPSGMWSVLQDVGSGLVAGTYTPSDSSKIMEENYLRLRQ